MGIEPTSQAWEARILPMNYTRIGKRIIAKGKGKSNHFLSRVFCVAFSEVGVYNGSILHKMRITKWMRKRKNTET